MTTTPANYFRVNVNDTAIAFNQTDNKNLNNGGYLSDIGDSTNSVKGHILIKNNSNTTSPQSFVVYEILNSATLSGGIYTVTVNKLLGTLPANDTVCAIEFYRSGDGVSVGQDIYTTSTSGNAAQTTGKYYLPSGAKKLTVVMVGAGGGGGGGPRGTTVLTQAMAGGGGGGGGQILIAELSASIVGGGGIDYAVGAAGGSGTSNTTAPGGNGGNGGHTWFGNYIARGGEGGKGGEYKQGNDLTANGGAGGKGGGSTSFSGNEINKLDNIIIIPGSNAGDGADADTTGTVFNAGENAQPTFYGCTGGGGGGSCTGQATPAQRTNGGDGGYVAGSTPTTDTAFSTQNYNMPFRSQTNGGTGARYVAFNGTNVNATNNSYSGCDSTIGLGGGGGGGRNVNYEQNVVKGAAGGTYGGGGGGGGSAWGAGSGNAATGGKGGAGLLLILINR